jgi:alkyl sulfatase BDS1-like metallo-beta-lactamase superfamily hydrolase
VCLCGNVFGALFGHIPNLVTMRGDRYRDAHTFVESLELVRRLQPEVLLTGHFDPIVGAELIDAELVRLRDAVLYVHDRTVEGMNAGTDVHTLMRDVQLPPELEVGEGYGKVAWDVRAIWETYAGWFHHRSTAELYPVAPLEGAAELARLAGVDAVTVRARELLDAGDPVAAVPLVDAALAVWPDHVDARALAVDAHQQLLAGSENFWESAWLRRQIDKLSS